MSGYNNFSYFNAPTTTNEWWPGKNSNQISYADERPKVNQPPPGNPWVNPVQYSDFSNPPMIRNVNLNLNPNVSQPIDNRSVESSQIRQVIQGTVTQLFSNFGYINDNIIFSRSDVMGPMVNIGDKVAVEATFQPNNPTKFKGERVYKVDESRFNSMPNTNYGKINTYPEVSTPRLNTPVNVNRWDVQKANQPIISRTELSVKNGSSNKNDYQVSSSRSMDSSFLSQVSPMKIDIAANYVSEPISSRLGTNVTKSISDKKNNSQTTSSQIDLTVSSRSTTNHDSTRGEYSSKTRSDNKISSPRIDSSEKRRSSGKSISPKHSNRSSRSQKQSSERKDNNREKNYSEIQAKKLAKMKRTQLRKAEFMKRKAASPIKFKITQKTVSKKATTSVVSSSSSATKSSTESKNQRLPKNYESFAFRELDCASIKNQFRTLSLPKEFFHISLKYQLSFPLNHPMKLGHNCQFKILDKKVKSVDPATDSQLRKEMDPKDADTTFVAKVMLISTEHLAKFYKSTLSLAEETEDENKILITKAIKFLVASVGEDKEFAIGGAWSPSLDGPDPESNPRVLINTAIRTCKAMTGIDLSHCTSWPKFLELHYYRPLQKKTASGSTKAMSDNNSVEEPIEYLEPRMETVVYYVPDIWNCMPSSDHWKEIIRAYKEQLTCLMCPPPVAIRPIGSPVDTDGSKKSPDAGDQEEDDSNGDQGDDKTTNSEEMSTEAQQPTHYSKLVIGSMKIIDIKKELELRKLSTKGVMDQLKARLKATLDREEIDEKNKDVPVVEVPESVTMEVTKTVLTEEQKNELKKLYSFSDRPEIIVHQNRKIFGNQMKIRTMSLHSLLSYYDIVLQESTFELAVFGKQFQEMLRRDAVFNIYKSIVIANEADLNNAENSSKKAKLSVTTTKRTVNKPLLFSCTMLDKDKTNKIQLEDLKLLIEGLGICLSSKQLSDVLDKVKDSSKYLHYRRLTDKEMTDTEVVKFLGGDVSEDLDYIKELALGNRALFESETVGMDISINDDEVERLKNELDKSERSRQTMALKVFEMKDATKKNIELVDEQTKEILKLKEEAAKYKSKYYDEIDRGKHHRGNYDRLLRQVKDIDVMAASLNKCVSETIAKHEIKKNKSRETSLVDKSKKKSVSVSVKTRKSSVSSSDLKCPSTDDNIMVIDDIQIIDPDTSILKETEQINTSVSDAVSEKVVVDNIGHEDEFDISKVSEYDLISIEEVDM